MTVAGDNLSPGERLQQARQEAGLELSELAERTKIPQASLQALERDEYHKVSGDLYVKSFLRSCAGEVGLDPEELIECYLGYTGESAGPDGESRSGWDEHDVQIRRVGLPWGRIAIGGVLVLAVLAGGWWWLGRGGQADVDRPVDHAAGGVDRAEISREPLESRHDSARDTLALGWQEGNAAPVPVARETLTPTEGAALPDSGASAPGIPLGTEISVTIEAPPGEPGLAFADGVDWPFVVRLLVDREGEFSAMKDAQNRFQAVRFPAPDSPDEGLPPTGVQAGRAYAVPGGMVVYWGIEDHISLKLGHVEGVELSFNGRVQDLSRFRAGEIILLDASVLDERSGD